MPIEECLLDGRDLGPQREACIERELVDLGLDFGGRDLRGLAIERRETVEHGLGCLHGLFLGSSGRVWALAPSIY